MQRRWLGFLLATVTACSPPVRPVSDGGDGGAVPDGALPDGALPDGAQPCINSSALVHSLYPSPLYLAPGATATVELRLSRDPRTCPMNFALTTADPALARLPMATASVAQFEGITTFTVTAGMAPGRTQVSVRQTDMVDEPGMGTMDVVVGEAARPACPAGTTAMGTLRPGARVAGAAGSPLASASVSAPMTATGIPVTPVTIACAPDQVPAGFVAVGPAVTFGQSLRKFNREIPVTLPVNPALVPPRYELQTEVSYTAPGLTTARVVPVANLRFTEDGKAITFDTPRLGTYQAVLRQGVGTRRVRRRMTYRSIMGVSMGAIGTSILGTRNPERFDYIAPMGGPADWAWFGNYFKNHHLAGFCTEAQRATLGAACDRASTDRTPTPDDLWTVDQTFEFFNYPDGRSGQGGTFDRRSYINIFRDLTHMFGNAVIQQNDMDFLPRGVPSTELMRTDAERCATPVVLQNYFDDEFNRDGMFPVITFCDGNRTPTHAGEWAGTAGNFPFEVSLAVDRNNNGRRDPGEPIIRNFSEPFRDVGTDGIPSAMESGYNASTNPDPAGDDYDRQFNPGGTEGNAIREAGEPFEDVGVDGIACPAGRTCPHDLGEGNGRFDTTAGVTRFTERNPRTVLATMPREQFDRLGVWADGGTRDLFNFGAVANHFVGATAQQQADLHYYNNFHSLQTLRPVRPNDDDGFDFLDVDWARLPRHAMLRYGFEDATEAQLLAGDGGHVGTVPQVANRLYAAIWRIQAAWPNLDRRIIPVQNTIDDVGRCANGYSCTFEFTSPSTGRRAPVGVALPPGYHRPENAGVRYPVIYLLHGYGMDPEGLAATGILVRQYMSSLDNASWQRPGKFILVFPDGRCRAGDNCLRGTFYTDSPFSNAVQMERFFSDLYTFVETTYRVRAPEELEITE